jgi:two-component system response regulator HydG
MNVKATSPARAKQSLCLLPRRKVLLVDDNLEDLLYYSAILQHEGYEVRPISSYNEAVARFERELFDLVIVSQGGPDFEGRSVLARAIEKDRRTPVLVLTRSADMGHYLEAMQLGAFDYLQVPLTPSEMTELAAAHLRPGAVPIG